MGHRGDRAFPRTFRSTAAISLVLRARCRPKTLIELAAEIINAGSKVAILAGQGCLTARIEILQFAETVGVLAFTLAPQVATVTLSAQVEQPLLIGDRFE